MAVWIKINKEDVSLEEIQFLFENPKNNFDIHYFDGTKGDYFELEIRGFQDGQERKAKKMLLDEIDKLRAGEKIMEIDYRKIDDWIEELEKAHEKNLLKEDTIKYNKLVKEYFSFNKEEVGYIESKNINSFDTFIGINMDRRGEIYEKSFQIIDELLNFGKKVDFQKQLLDSDIIFGEMKEDFCITLNNAKTEEIANFEIHIEQENPNYYFSPVILKYYDLKFTKSNGEEFLMHFEPNKKGDISTAKEAINLIKQQIKAEKKEEIYAYLIDDFGITTDISKRIREISKEDIGRNKYFQRDEKKYEIQFMVDIYGESNMDGTLFTNAIHIECNESSISGIEAPNAEVINCAYCDNIEEIKAPNCKDIYCEKSRLLKEENMELHPDCNIEGLKELNQLKR